MLVEHRKIGSLEVSVVGIGANNFGGRIDEARTREVIDAALAVGVNFIDTADEYPVVPPGRATKSEEFIGRALSGRRDEVIIATKFEPTKESDRLGGASVEYISRALDASLRRLGTDHVDLYQLHRPDPQIPIAETLGALNTLVDAGKVIEVGCSNFTVAMLREARSAVLPGNCRFVSVQNDYSLLNRAAELDVLPECEASDLAFLPYFPLYNGLLTGKYRRSEPPPEGTRIATAAAERQANLLSVHNLEIVESLIEFANERGHSILELAFARLLANPCLASVIAGATSSEQVRANATAGSWSLTTDEIAEVDKITTGS
jgi:aryl-alcohol dehydrogenase-like predicted oxidoreductase